MRIRSFIIAYALVLAILLFADRRPGSTPQDRYSHVVDLTDPQNAMAPHSMESRTRIIAPGALIPGSWAAGQIPAERLVAPLDRGEGESLYKLQQQLRDVMWEHVGLIRSAAGLKSALKEIEEIGQRATAAPVPGGPAYNLAWQDWLNLQSQAVAAWLIARSALERNESRGAHYRSDYPVPGSELYSVSVGADDSSGLRVWTEPVKLTRLSPSGTRQPAGVDVGD